MAMAEVGRDGMYGEDEEEAPEPTKGYKVKKATKERVRPEEYEAQDNDEDMQDEDDEGNKLTAADIQNAEKELLFWV